MEFLEKKQFEDAFYEKFGATKELDSIYSIIEKLCENDKLDRGLYYRHNIGVAKIMLEMKMAKDVILAGLLHNAIEHGIDEKILEKKFDKKIVSIIKDKERLEKSLLFEPQDPENSRKKLLVVLSSNPDIAFLELAERLDKLRRISVIPKEKRTEFLIETKEVFASLAHEISAYNISSEMNEIIFRYEEPEKYSELKNKVMNTIKKRKEDIEKSQEKLKEKLKEAGIEFSIAGRTKTIYSTYSKIERKKVSLNEIYDLSAIRIILNSIKDCYEVLGIVHSLWKPILNEFDDYIAKPKSNGYKSLHTTVVSENKIPLEIQIRTKEMHEFAEHGIASHWRYKSGKKDSENDKKIKWIKQILEWKKNAKTENSIEIFKKEIFAMTPQGKVIELPERATVIDFAYGVHSEIGNKCKGAKINNALVSLNTEIKNGDVVEIITSENQKPKMSWLSFSKTSKAKQKIRSKLNIQTSKKDAVKSIKSGHAIKTNDAKIKLAQCCSPLPGDEIQGFKTTKRKISVHRTDCSQIDKTTGKKIDVVWADNKSNYETEITVKSNDRLGIIKDILEIFSKSKISVTKANAKKITEKTAIIKFGIKVKNLDQLIKITEKITKIKDVINVYRN